MLILGGSSPRARATEVLPVSELHPGMRGVGRTVFQGDHIDEFGVEILGVLKNARPKGDLILFRGDGDVLEHAGIIQGMSGSPVYIDGKLIGAVSFAFPGTMDPIGAITPIGEMLELLSDDSGAPDKEGSERIDGSSPGSSSEGGRAGAGPESPLSGSAESDRGASGPGNRDRFDALWGQFLRVTPSEEPPAAADGAGRVDSPQGALQQLATPISLSGWSEPLCGDIVRTLGNLGFLATAVTGGGGEAVAGAGAGGPSAPQPQAKRLEPGASVGIQLIGGDADLVAIGTVTYVDGDRILALGHPMMQGGAVRFPMSGAWIHTILPNRTASTKMGSSTGLVGGIYDDRRSGVEGRLGGIPSRLPIRVILKRPDGSTDTYRYFVVRHDFFTPVFLPWTVTNSYLADGWVYGDASVQTDVVVHYNGTEAVHRTERLSTDVPGTALGADITLPAALLLVNPFEKVRLDSVAVGIDFNHENTNARIVEVRSDRRRAKVGEVVHLEAVIEPFRGDPVTREVRIKIPAAWAGLSLQMHVGATADFVAWDQDRVPDKYTPLDLTQLVEMIERMPNDSALTVRVYSAAPGILLQGVELPELPPSLGSATATDYHPRGVMPVPGSLLLERHEPTPWVLTGGETVELEVADR